MTNQASAIARALAAGDVRDARVKYDEYVTSMEREGQKPKSPKDFGIPPRT